MAANRLLVNSHQRELKAFGLRTAFFGFLKNHSTPTVKSWACNFCAVKVLDRSHSCFSVSR